MASDREDASPGSDASFTTWLGGLRFTVDRTELEVLRAAYNQLVRMNELNRAPVSAGTDR